MVKNRIQLAESFSAWDFKVGAEIGVLEGHYSEILFKSIPGLKLYCIDNWKNVPDRVNKEVKAREVLDHYNAEIIKAHSMDAVKEIEDESLDFVYIDANHQYHSVIDDITQWAKKVRKGGIVSGDDYYHIKGSKWGVVPAVDDYVRKHGYTLFTSPWDDTVPEEDSHNQWWFIK